MQDVQEREDLKQYMNPRSQQHDKSARNDPAGFKVRDAPWHSAPDTASNEDFPSIGDAPKQSKSAGAWGPRK